MQGDTFAEYVRRRLDGWGNEFSLARDCEYLGHQSKNMLQVLIEHRGEMPAKATGYKPLEVCPIALQVEEAVFQLSRVNRSAASVLRGYYCGSGRRNYERLEIANLLIVKSGGRAVSRRHYHNLRQLGEQFVYDRFLELVRTA